MPHIQVKAWHRFIFKSHKKIHPFLSFSPVHHKILADSKPEDMNKVSSAEVVRKKQKVIRFVLRKLVDNDQRNLDGLPNELAELVTQDQTEF